LPMHFKFFLRLLSQGKVSPSKIFNTIANVVQFSRRRVVPGTVPTVVELNMTNRCNIRCVTCRHTEEEIIPWADVEHPAEKRTSSIAVGTMHSRLLEKITADEAIHSVLLWKLYGSGESIMNPDIYGTIRRLTENRAATILSTNGMALTRENVRKLMNSGLDLLKIAVSGFSQGVYSKYHRGGDIERILNNLRTLEALRRDAASSMVVVVDYLMFEHNRHEVAPMRAFCKETGLDMMVREASLMKQADAGISATSAILQSPRCCDWIWKMMTFDWDGTVRPCCWYFFSEHPEDLGIYEAPNTIRSIWNSDRFAHYRRVHAQQGRSAFAVCRDCYQHGLNFGRKKE
jgi:pyruvate-formate lyase-activating enzyme